MSDRPSAAHGALRVAVIGAGAAGLMSTLVLAGAGVPVDLFALEPALGSSSALESSGILAGEGEDDFAGHFLATLHAGEFLAHQPPVRGMVRAAPGILDRLVRMAVPFERALDGKLRPRRLPGSDTLGAHGAGGLTGHAVVSALESQVRRAAGQLAVDAVGVTLAGEPLVRRREHWDFIRLVLADDGTCVGVVAQDLRTMEIHALRFEAVVLATGGIGGLFQGSIAALNATGSAAMAVHLQGAAYANAELIRVHPAAHGGTEGTGKPRAVPEIIRADGGRIWVPRDRAETRAPRELSTKERDYLLESHHPAARNGVFADVAAREIVSACVAGRGVFDVAAGRNLSAVYLDVPKEHAALLQERVGLSFLPDADEWDDALPRALRVFPSVEGSCGGLWVDYESDASGAPVVGSPRNHATNVPGLYAVGDVEYQYHGAHALPGNALLACLYGAMLTGPAVTSYRDMMEKSAADRSSSVFDRAERAARAEHEALLGRTGRSGPEDNPYAILSELREAMSEACGLLRERERLVALDAKLDELGRRARAAPILDASPWLNQMAPFARRLEAAIGLGRLCAQSALRREESRGAHVREDAPRRDDERFLRNTIAVVEHGPSDDGAASGGATRFVDELAYPCGGITVRGTSSIDTSLSPPAPRAAEPTT